MSLETHEREMTLSERARDAVVDAGQLLMSGFEWWLLRSSQIPATPFLDRADFAWAPALEAGWRDIRAELDEVLTQRDDLPNIQDIVADTVPISRDDRWKTFFFTAYGYRSEGNRARCPATTALIDQIPGLVTAFFSILSPGKHIPPHRGPFRGVVRCHLALKIPDPPDSCGIRVNGETRHWAEGKTMFFDDGYEHSAWNDSDETRVVLWLDVIGRCGGRPPASTARCSRGYRPPRSGATPSASTRRGNDVSSGWRGSGPVLARPPAHDGRPGSGPPIHRLLKLASDGSRRANTARAAFAPRSSSCARFGS